MARLPALGATTLTMSVDGVRSATDRPGAAVVLEVIKRWPTSRQQSSNGQGRKWSPTTPYPAGLTVFLTTFGATGTSAGGELNDLVFRGWRLTSGPAG